MKFTTEQLDAIAAKLREMPPVEKKTKPNSRKDAVRLLSEEIIALQKLGHTLEEISSNLRGEDTGILTPALQSYLQRAKPEKKTANDSPVDVALVERHG